MRRAGPQRTATRTGVDRCTDFCCGDAFSDKTSVRRAVSTVTFAAGQSAWGRAGGDADSGDRRSFDSARSQYLRCSGVDMCQSCRGGRRECLRHKQVL